MINDLIKEKTIFVNNNNIENICRIKCDFISENVAKENLLSKINTNSIENDEKNYKDDNNELKT